MKEVVASKWTSETEPVFQQIKQNLIDALASTILAKKCCFVVKTEFRNVGLDGYLIKGSNSKKGKFFCPVYLQFLLLSSTQTKYGTPKLEMLALVTSMKKTLPPEQLRILI